MLCKYIKGRLGNQMFQYASMRAFQQKHFKDSKIVFSFKDVEKYYKKGRYNQIDSLCDFNCVYETNKTIHLNIKQKVLVFLISSILFLKRYRGAFLFFLAWVVTTLLLSCVSWLLPTCTE